MNALHKCGAIIAIVITLFLAVSAHAQNVAVVHVDITNGSLLPPNQGRNGWDTDAYRFLQDALDVAPSLFNPPFNFDEVHLWVAAGWDDVNEAWIPYLPPQQFNSDYDPNTCEPDWDCCDPFSLCEGREASFELINNVEIYGGFPPDPHTWNDGDGAEFIDRNPFSYITVLDGFAICIGSIRSKAQGKTRNPENRGLRPVRDGA